jgi:hypothetical protein
MYSWDILSWQKKAHWFGCAGGRKIQRRAF